MADIVRDTHRSTGLVDVLDRVLDKGLLIAGDIRVSLAEVELLTIRIRLIVCSIDKAEQIGLDWWRHDRTRAAGRMGEEERLRAQVRSLQRQVRELTRGRVGPPAAPVPLRRRRARGSARS